MREYSSLRLEPAVDGRRVLRPGRPDDALPEHQQGGAAQVLLGGGAGTERAVRQRIRQAHPRHPRGRVSLCVL